MTKIKLIIFIIICFFMSSVEVKALEDGIYIFRSSINNNYVVDVNNGIAVNNANIKLYNDTGTNAQRYYVKKVEDDTYVIESLLNRNYVFDIENINISSGTNVQIYKSNNTKAQKWVFKEHEDGYYSICSKYGDYCLDATGGIATNGTNIQLFANNSTNAQKFRIEKFFEPKKTISDGLYTINSSIKNDFVLDIYGGYVRNNNNIQAFNLNNTDAQKWYITHLGGGYYSIKAYLNNNYSLDVAGASRTNGTNLQLFISNGSDAQKWIIHDLGNGYYNIVSKCNNLVMDVSGGSSNNGTNVQLYKYNNSNAQKFKFEPVKEVGLKTISDGYYFISSSLNSQKVLDIENLNISSLTNVQLYSLNSSMAQKWYVKYLNDGTYAILSDKDNSFGLEYDTITNNARINNYLGEDNQKWIIKEFNNNYYIIASNGKYLDLQGGSTNNNTNVRLFDSNSTKAQKFNFVRTASGLSEKIIQDGIYRIASAIDNSMVLDLAGGSKNNGTNIQLFKTNGSNAQKWKVEYQSNGYYKISSLIDLTKVLDVVGGKAQVNSNVQSYDNNNSLAQQWLIKDAGDGYYYIVSNCGGYNLDVDNGSTYNGTNIKIFSENGSKAQKFKFIKSSETTRVIDVSYHQGTIDWNKVYNTGIYGVILRIGYWQTEDARLSEYLSEVKRLGIPYGIYLFSYANTTSGANTEAEFTKQIINKYNLEPTLGIYYDLEDWYISETNTSNTLSSNEYDDIAYTYINNVSSYVGNKYKVKIYADLNHANNRFGSYGRSQTDWIAHYASSCGFTGSYSLWQYTSSATLDGIHGYVDMNYLH